ncbi:MAG: hypothetical protein IJ609_05020 [Paludibacteraceae bacterium]|nr:hypothetical protein [Paludibacteraceae bacterium]
MTIKRLLILPLLLALPLLVRAWAPWPLPMDSVDTGFDRLSYSVGLSAVASYGAYAPFWLQSNRLGDISAAPFSGMMHVGLYKPATRHHRWYDYDFAVDLAGRLDTRGGTGWFRQLYAHLRLLYFDFTVGITPMSCGNQDPLLSSGGLLFSNNAHPLPRITVGLDQWTPFPLTFGFLEIKGGITHAWVIDQTYVQNYFIHHKFIGGRLGGHLPLRVSYEFHHAAQWGGMHPIYGNLGNNWRAFSNAFLARSGGAMANDQINAQGNHLGMQCLGLDVVTDPVSVSLYWQSIFEDGPVRFIGCGLNARDGLWGVSLRFHRFPYISGVCYEVLNTTDQSGPFHDRDGYVFGGRDTYYTNGGVYRNGWNYFLRSIGTPLITSPLYNTDGSLATLNSRVRTHHLALMGNIEGFRYRLMATYTRNWGNYAATGGPTHPISRNTALLLAFTKHVPQAWHLDFSLDLAADFGTQFGNTFGAMLTVSKSGLLTQW